MAVDPEALDLGQLSLFVGYAFAEAVQREIERAGFSGLRFSHGFLFQHLVEKKRSIGELCARLEVSQQAVSKSVAELEALGYVERVPDPGDRRLKHVRLSARGRQAVRAARRARAELQRKLLKRARPAALENARSLLSDWLEALGGTEAVRARRIVAPR